MAASWQLPRPRRRS